MANSAVGLIEQINASSNLYNLASTAYGYCETAAGTQEKAVNIAGFKYIDGVTIHVKFRYGNTVSNPQLNVSSEGPKSIVYRGATQDTSDNVIAAENVGTVDGTTGWNPGAVLTLTYDGTNWVRDQGYNTNTTYSTLTQTLVNTGTETTGKLVTAKILKDTVTNAINALDVDNATSGTGNHITGFGKGKTLATLTETNGIISATFQDIEIAASKITSGTLGVGHGGTGADSFTSGEVLVGAGSSAITTKAIDTTVTANSSNLITSGAVATAISGLTGAMHLLGVTTTDVSSGNANTTATVSIGGSNVTAVNGDVVLYNTKEFVWANNKWNLLGDEGSYALDSNVVHKTDFDGLGKLIYGSGASGGGVSYLSANSTTTGKVLYMASSTPSWKKVSIAAGTWPTVSVTKTVEFLKTATLTTGTAFSVPNVTDAGSAAEASVTNAILTITNGVAPTLGTAFSIPNVTGVNTTAEKALTGASINTTNAAWPTISYSDS